MYVAETLRPSPVCTSYVPRLLSSSTLPTYPFTLQGTDGEWKTPHPTHRNNKPTIHPSFLPSFLPSLLPNISQAGHGTLSPPPPNPFLSERAERTTTGFTFAYPTLD